MIVGPHVDSRNVWALVIDLIFTSKAPWWRCFDNFCDLGSLRDTWNQCALISVCPVCFFVHRSQITIIKILPHTWFLGPNTTHHSHPAPHTPPTTPTPPQTTRDKSHRHAINSCISTTIPNTLHHQRSSIHPAIIEVPSHTICDAG